MPSIDDNGLTEAKDNTKERQLNDAIKVVKDNLSKTNLNRHSEYIEAVRLAYWLLNIASQGDDVAEYFTFVEEKLNGIALGQVVMEHTNPDGLVNKRLWFDAAEHMGPDFAQGMYQAAVFVTKVA